MNGEPARRPGGAARLLLLALVGAGFLAVFSVGFPPAARDRLPVLVLAVGLGLLAAANPQRGLTVFSFLFPLAGLGNRAFAGADAIAWPVLLFGGFAGGWTFRFLYDFESRSDPSRVDPVLRALAAVWTLSTLLAIVRARTLWAVFHGLDLRAANVEGLLDTAAIRESVLALAALAAGAAYFFILRRSGEAVREKALRAALWGVGLSGAAAIGERLGLPPGETSAFWKMTGRLSGGAMDPNALGLLCGLAAVVTAARLLSTEPRKGFAAALIVPLGGGLALSGSRSGLAAAGIGLLVLVLAPGLPARRRLAAGGLGLALVLALGMLVQSDARGSVGARLAEFLDTSLPAEYRASARPVLWSSAVRLFRRVPITGSGLGSFSWQLPTLLREQGRALPMRDNPGNAYLQALAETGVIGFLLTLTFAGSLAREAWIARRNAAHGPLHAGSGAAVIAFLATLFAGSHWFAPDVALLFFLLASIAARPAVSARSRQADRVRGLAVAAYAVAAAWAALATLSDGDAFRYRPRIGFHARETGARGPFYWTERRFAVRLSPGQTMRLALAHYTPEGRSVTLAADSGGRTVFERTLQSGQTLALRLTGGAAASRVIRFTLSRAFVPRRLGISGDRRELGIMAVFPEGS